MNTADQYLFLDRDGVINTIEHGFVNKPSDFIFADQAIEALKVLRKRFKRVFVVTNQAGVGYGYMKESELRLIHEHMAAELKKEDVVFDGIYYCPDRVSTSSPCRKPNGGMARQAQKDFPEVDFNQSWMVGDRESDIDFGKRLHMKTVRLLNKDSTDVIKNEIRADYYYKNLFEFASSFND